MVALQAGAGVSCSEIFAGNQEGVLAQLKARRVDAAAVNSRFLAPVRGARELQFREIFVSEGLSRPRGDRSPAGAPRPPWRRCVTPCWAWRTTPRRRRSSPALKFQGFDPAQDRDYDGRPPRVSPDRPMRSLRALLVGLDERRRRRRRAGRPRSRPRRSPHGRASADRRADAAPDGGRPAAPAQRAGGRGTSPPPSRRSQRQLARPGAAAGSTRADGQKLMLDASPAGPPDPAPRWLAPPAPRPGGVAGPDRGRPGRLRGARRDAVLRPSRPELWDEIRDMVSHDGPAAGGCSSCSTWCWPRPPAGPRAARGAARFGGGDFSARLPTSAGGDRTDRSRVQHDGAGPRARPGRLRDPEAEPPTPPAGGHRRAVRGGPPDRRPRASGHELEPGARRLLGHRGDAGASR